MHVMALKLSLRALGPARLIVWDLHNSGSAETIAPCYKHYEEMLSFIDQRLPDDVTIIYKSHSVESDHFFLKYMEAILSKITTLHSRTNLQPCHLA